MKKALINASVASMIYKFNMDNIELLRSMGYRVEVACNFSKDENPIKCEEIEKFKALLREMDVAYYETDCPRSILSLAKMFKTYKQLAKIINRGEYNLIHTQSPIGGVLCRLAARKARKKGTRVIYTAHGFHFYRSAPLPNWLFFYPVEKFCARYTDVLITINQEDYLLAQKKMKAKEVTYVPGVGIDLSRFERTAKDHKSKRQELNIPDDAILLLSVGELIARKNQETLIQAVSQIENVYLAIAGKGALFEKMDALISELGVQTRVKLLGYRADILDLCKSCDMFVFPSFHEGLPVSLMEAMASGMPCVVSNIRGNTDLIDENGGALFDPHSSEACKCCIEGVLCRDLASLGNYNKEKIKSFDISKVREQMAFIYQK